MSDAAGSPEGIEERRKCRLCKQGPLGLGKQVVLSAWQSLIRAMEGYRLTGDVPLGWRSATNIGRRKMRKELALLTKGALP